jgi:Uma2 family endonuclease
MTAGEYLALGETAERYELIDGVVCMSPTPSPLHQKIQRLLQRQFEAFIDGHPGYDYYPCTDVRLGDRLVVAPDLACYVPGRIVGVPAELTVPPDLAIEILSPSNRAHDLTVKRGLYARHGVAEYWVVDPREAWVRCFRLKDGEMREHAVAGESLSSSAWPGFVLDLEPLARLMSEG